MSERNESSDVRVLSQAIVFAVLSLLGGGLSALLLLTDVDWFFPTLIYGLVLYFVWQKLGIIQNMLDFRTEKTVQLEGVETECVNLFETQVRLKLV